MSLITYSQFQSKYRFEGQISQGTFGRVCKIKQISTKKSFALKKLSIKKAQQLKDAKNQISILTKFKHPFVVQLLEYYNFQITHSFNHVTQEFGLIMQMASESVQQLIRGRKSIGSPEDILKKIFGLVQVLALFQSQNIAHRDIKPANILIFERSPSDYIWKLADFGLTLNLNQSSQIQNIAGSFDYVSPILKRKFKFRNLKIKTNPFKDDVYSLGVTLLQIFTGSRKYTDDALNKLKIACRDQNIIRLVDLMLTEQQSLRPCFKQLLQIMKTGFDYLLKLQAQKLQHQLHENKMTKQLDNYQSRKQNQFDFNSNTTLGTKTTCKKNMKIPQISIMKLENKKIQCITNLDGKIVCGCRGGEILFINNWKQEQIVQIQGGAVHSNFIAQFFEDNNGNIWSVGGDSNIIKWKKFGLLKALMTNVKKQSDIRQNMFKKQLNVVKTRKIISNSDNISKKIKIPYLHETGSNCIFAIDQDRYAVGFNDGYIFIQWNWKQFHHRVHSQPIINIKISNDGSTLYTCSTDGCVKSIDIKTLTLNNRFFYCQEIITSIETFDEQSSQSISVKTLNGTVIFLNMNLQVIFRSRVQLKSQNLLVSGMHKGKCLSVAETGEIVGSNDEQIVNLCQATDGVRGWNCVNFISAEQILIGSFEGVIAYIQL